VALALFNALAAARPLKPSNPSGQKFSSPTRTDNASTNYRDAPYWFVKSHVIVSLNFVSASYTGEERFHSAFVFADWKNSSDIGQLLCGN
jgi:hypothetical protein